LDKRVRRRREIFGFSAIVRERILPLALNEFTHEFAARENSNRRDTCVKKSIARIGRPDYHETLRISRIGAASEAAMKFLDKFIVRHSTGRSSDYIREE